MSETDTRLPRVLYVGGTGRTGSTVLDSLLGLFPGVFSGGELTFLWEYSLAEGGRCSCGSPLWECPIWSEVLETAFGRDGVDTERMTELRTRFWSLHLPLMVFPWFRRRGLARLDEYPEVVEQLYHAIARSTGAELIVDSSKEPHYSYILRESTDLDVYFLQLVRDPRAVGMSWLRPRPELGFRRPLRASLYYNVSNVAGEMLWRSSERYAFMRYEDFVARPHEALEAIGRFVGLELDDSAVLRSDNSFERPKLHSAWGNPNRFENGRMTLAPDDEWIEQLGRRDRAALTVMNMLLMRRYGYSVLGHPKTLRPPKGRLAARQLARP